MWTISSTLNNVFTFCNVIYFSLFQNQGQHSHTGRSHVDSEQRGVSGHRPSNHNWFKRSNGSAVGSGSRQVHVHTNASQKVGPVRGPTSQVVHVCLGLTWQHQTMEMSKRRIHSGKIIVKIRIQKFAHCTSLGKGNENGLKNMFLKPQQNNSNIGETRFRPNKQFKYCTCCIIDFQ